VFEGELLQAGFPDNSFDVVTAWHVVEHLQDPHALVREVQRILRPGGLFVVEVPNFASWQARLGQDRWFHLDVPRHLLHYTPHALLQLLNHYGLRVVTSHSFSLESGPIGMLLSILNRIGLPPNYLWQWLKRSNSCGNYGFSLAILYSIAVIAISGPALFLETLASSMRAGGIVRVIAQK
jgi:SAM-dependent methyltransferase